MDIFWLTLQRAINSFAEMNYWLIPVILLLLVCRMLLGSTSWWNAVRHGHPDEDIPWSQCFKAHSFGIGIGAFLPSRGNDILRPLRLHLACKRRMTVVSISAAGLVDALFGAFLTVVVMICLLTSGIMPLSIAEDSVGQLGGLCQSMLRLNYQIIILMSVLLVVAVVLVVFGSRYFGESVSRRLRLAISEIGRGLSAIRNPRWYVEHIVAYQVVDTLVAFTVIWSFAQAFGFHAPFLAFLVIQFGGNVAGIFSILPQNAIVKQGLLAIMLAGMVSPADVAAFSLSMDASVLVVNASIAIAVQCWCLRTVSLRAALGRKSPLQPAADTTS